MALNQPLQEHPELLPLIQRKFRSAGDVDTAQRLVFDSRGLQRARELAAQHASLAVRAVRLLRVMENPLPESCITEGSAQTADICSAVHDSKVGNKRPAIPFLFD